MKILSINSGNSFMKFSLFNMPKEELIAQGVFENIGIENTRYIISYKEFKIEDIIELKDHLDAAKFLLDKLVELQIIGSTQEIDGIGHRIVQGGNLYTNSVMITNKISEDILKLSDLAPLHNTAHYLGIKAFNDLLPRTPMVAVFDTAFNQTLDEANFMYAVPYSWYSKYKVRKYGFHGTSHRYISETISKLLNKKDLRIISCHLGNGSSISAIKDGKCIDTSMGFTPLTGVMMCTRTGDVDPSIIPYMMEKEGKSAGEILHDFNTRSGFFGISEFSGNFKDIIEESQKGNDKCRLAVEMYIRSTLKYIAEYYVELQGVDVICFTGGIGENSAYIRKMIIDRLKFLGIRINDKQNENATDICKINDKDSKVLLYVIPNNVEVVIARDTFELIDR